MSAGGVSEEYLEIELRSPDQIARRILVLNAIVQRVTIEHDHHGPQPPGQDSDEALFDLRASLALAGAEQELTERERRLIGAPAGEVDEDDQYDLAWDLEALSAILTAVRLVEALPSPPLLTDPNTIPGASLDGAPDAAKLAASLELPTEESVARTRELAELWLWRASAERELREASVPGHQTLSAEIREVAAEARGAGLISTTKSGDFETGGRSITEWSDEQLAGYEFAAEARLKALNWLCGFGTTWDDAPIEV